MEFKMYGDYKVFENGRVYSNITNKMLSYKPDSNGYVVYTLFMNHETVRIKAHQLVAKLFLEKPNSREILVINHKDGNKLNNHYSNLEYCTNWYNNYHARVNKLNDVSKSNSERWNNEKFREKTSRNISKSLLEHETFKGKNNPRFRYEIFDDNGNEYDRHSLSELLGLSQSFTDALIKKDANGKTNKHFDKFGIRVRDIKKKSQSTIEKVS